MAKKPGSRRWKAEQAKLQKDNPQKKDELLMTTKANTVSVGSLNIFEALFNSIFDNKNALYNTAEKTALLNACIFRIAKDFAKTPLYLGKQTSNNEWVKFNSSKSYKHKLSSPNPFDTEYSLKMKIAFGLLIEGIVWKVRTKTFDPSTKTQKEQFYIFQNRYVRTETDKNGSTAYYVKNENKVETKIAPEDIDAITIPGYGKNGYEPYSHVKAALQEILLYKNTLDHENQFISKGMMARGFLELSPETTYTFEQRQQISREFSDRTSGQNATSTLALPPGITYKPVQSTNEEGMILELLGFAKESVLAVFGIPKSLFDQDFASYATADVQLNDYYKNTIEPFYKLVEDSFNNWLGLTAETEYFQFSREHVKSAEKEKAFAEADLARANAAAVKQSLKHVSINEVRQTAGLAPVMTPEGTLDPAAEEIPLDPVQEDIVPLADIPTDEEQQ